MVENPRFWEDHNVGLAISANAGPIVGDRGPWFKYPAGCLAINVPMTAINIDRTIDLMTAAMPVVVGTLAAGRNAALHCNHCFHRGPLLAMMFVMAARRGRSAA